MSPAIELNRRRPIQFLNRSSDFYVDKGQVRRRTSKQGVNQTKAFGLLFHDQCSPGSWSNCWVDPSLQSHSTAKIQGDRVIHSYPAGSIEAESISVPSLV